MQPSKVHFSLFLRNWFHNRDSEPPTVGLLHVWTESIQMWPRADVCARFLLPPFPHLPSSPLLFMPSFFRASCLLLSFLLFGLVSASRVTNRGRIPGLLKPLNHHAHTPRKISRRSCRPSLPAMTTSCFPAYGFQMPSQVPSNLDGWWCNPADEYAFLGFSYEITPCEFLTFHTFSVLCTSPFLGQSLAQLQKDFADIRNTFNARYVRLYGACDNAGF